MAVAPTPAGRRAPPSSQVPMILFVAVAAVVVGLGIGYQLSKSSGTPSLEGSGVPAVQVRTVAPFDAVDLAGANQVTVTVGPKQSVVVRGDDNLLRQVTTQVTGGTLQIGTRGSFTSRSDMSVAVSVPTLDVVTLSGAGSLRVTGVDARVFGVLLSGTGVVRVGGQARQLTASIVGAGDAELGALVAARAQAQVDGTGRIVVRATRSLTAAVHGVGSIVYLGTPKHLTTSVTGTGSIAAG